MGVPSYSQTMKTFELWAGSAPLLISSPHSAQALTADVRARMTPAGHAVADTDWFVAALYAPIAQALGASFLVPTYSRYLIDLNRAPDGAALYPGQSETGLCPLLSFADEPLYLPGLNPDAQEVALRRERYWQPYHDALKAELERLRALHGAVLLWDAHSIAAEVPKFFQGRLPDLNIGSNDGATASAAIHLALRRCCEKQTRFSHVFNGRFKGGYITRRYGQPQTGVHAIQLETNQDAYMDLKQTQLLPSRASELSATIHQLLGAAIAAL